LFSRRGSASLVPVQLLLSGHIMSRVLAPVDEGQVGGKRLTRVRTLAARQRLAGFRHIGAIQLITKWSFST